ncbi:PGF-CTERM-anchored ABC transporter substrate-binding protein [Halorubrum ezzemoulense]|uniref:PGF-CTERM-anchored ABC transporter substrate-binding protein n=1 Tax=Halorubrum ezzemoulense TaxID=337243 RepID=UPI0023302A20|nr:PGF-CTERM-anchored ABC transporter substrate-binding protein [Halorubrum ezzemoulense]MDB2270029.1 PGF-CTERM-anchored ABC transporter substrate-binding protein [Halorubrum ezzemoulense]
MRNSFAIAMAALVATALIGGVAGTAAGAQPTIATDRPIASAQLTGGAQPAAGAQSAAGTQPAVGSAAGAGAAPAQTDGACGFPLNATDATGTTITLEERPERITTLNPSAAQTLWELGEQDRVVGVSRFALYLDGAEERANVSAEFGASVERVVDTEPDLVLAPNSSAADVGPLREQGLKVYHFPAATSIDDIAEKTETIGRLVGACDAASETNEEMYDAVDAAENRTAGVDRPAALYPLGGGYVAANNTFIDAIMNVGGADNVAAEYEAYPQLSDEVILQTDPELILVTNPEAAILAEEPYASTTAGVEENYVVMNVDYLNQPAPRSVIRSTTTLSNAVVELQEEGSESTDGTESGESSDDGSSDGDSSGSDDTSDGGDSSTDGMNGNETDAGGSDGDTGAEVPGFGVVAAAIALLATGLLARRD